MTDLFSDMGQEQVKLEKDQDDYFGFLLTEEG